ncbi:hypothetical protein CLV24_113141 [Pontibacter ummariensis]|uniref:DUF4982 domain-containing protein n=1 Tax=Pontibacter ummariensis TaxID=1610492 RepID=A0A239H7N1_9BACT|nr:DUF4982 domain-containing protein [Pontibacter ummariensis]PRY10721.1 hypothetical protein CLV24_113141 [Pontibacter ummariensis]SNS77370.1 hypothetical protein SAMN06296052_11314 [Pontibacter ummariensis]
MAYRNNAGGEKFFLNGKSLESQKGRGLHVIWHVYKPGTGTLKAISRING